MRLLPAFASALLSGCLLSAQAGVQLFERYPEQWRGHVVGEPIMLAGRQLVTTAGQLQRLSPSVYSARSLRNVNIYLTLPSAIAVQPSKAWALSRNDGGAQTWTALLVYINAGERISSAEGFFFTAPTPGLIFVDYIITAQEMGEPLRGRFAIEVTP